MIVRHQEILRWMKENRPDFDIRPAFSNQGLDALMAMAFAAGRDYQRRNPDDREVR